MIKNTCHYVNGRMIHVYAVDEVVGIFEQGKKEKSRVVLVLDEEVTAMHNLEPIDVPDGVRGWSHDKMAQHFESIL